MHFEVLTTLRRAPRVLAFTETMSPIPTVGTLRDVYGEQLGAYFSSVSLGRTS